jgi:hypothetical protein
VGRSGTSEIGVKSEGGFSITNQSNSKHNLTGNQAMNFTNTDCFWNGEVINIKVIDQVCQEVRIKVVSRLHNPVMEIHSQIRPKIYREGCIVDWFD